jgi:hypothetical protein
VRFHICIGYNTDWTTMYTSSSWAFSIACSLWISSCVMRRPDCNANPRRIQQTSNHHNITTRPNLLKSFYWPHFLAAKSWVASGIWKESKLSPKQVHKFWIISPHWLLLPVKKPLVCNTAYTVLNQNVQGRNQCKDAILTSRKVSIMSSTGSWKLAPR